MDDPRVELLQRLSEPILTAESVELVELSCRRQGGQLVVRFLVDKVGGVTIQNCARLNQLIGQAFDGDGALAEESYTLEVSSPGLDRPLISKRDFERAIGEDLQLELLESGRGTKQVKGMLLAVQHEAIVVTTPAGNVTIPFGQIQRAKKALRW